MIKYAIFSTQFEGQMILGYENGILTFLSLEKAVLSEHQHLWTLENLRIREQELHEMVGRSKTMRIEVLPEDLSFERFWNEYGYKIGDKKRAEKLWNGLTDADKIKVFQSIPKYNSYLRMHPNIERLYPQTFLHQRRFENQYR